MTNVGVLDVAKYILSTSDESMTTMKLQKLVYYCQAWHVTWTGEGLFTESTRAWANGPVVRELFNLHRGRYAVCADELTGGDAAALTVDQRAVVDSVLATYGSMTGSQLSVLTHAENPWQTARGKSTNGSSSDVVITLDSMQKFYAGLSRHGGVSSADQVNFPVWA